MSQYVLDKLAKGEHVLCLGSLYYMDPIEPEGLEATLITSFSNDMYWDTNGDCYSIVIPIQVIGE